MRVKPAIDLVGKAAEVGVDLFEGGEGVGGGCTAGRVEMLDGLEWERSEAKGPSLQDEDVYRP